MNNIHINEAIYIYSYDKYMSSFSLSRKYFWACRHKLAANVLALPNLVHANTHQVG